MEKSVENDKQLQKFIFLLFYAFKFQADFIEILSVSNTISSQYLYYFQHSQ